LIKRSINKSALSNILFVSSIAAIRGYRAKAAYSASKGALDSYMRVLSKELAPKVAVNSILPGAMPTPMTEREFNDPELVKHFKDIYPMGLGSVDQVVAVVKAYHDLENSWVTGQQVIVDGGLTS
jgi:NAD(P)-dependent dehydrogenase (short-subunit alcohol dehydrogenase family)